MEAVGGAGETVDDEVEVVDDGRAEAVDAGDGAEAQGERDESVLDNVLAVLFAAEAGEKAGQRVGGSCDLRSCGQRASLGPFSDAYSNQVIWIGNLEALPEGGSGEGRSWRKKCSGKRG